MSYAGYATASDRDTDYNAHEFITNQIINRLATSTLVKVVAVKAVGELAPVGFVDVQPMVHQVDGKGGSPTPHGVLSNVPYFRIQGGTDAVIMDPKVGDIGIAVFCSRDISTAKNSRKPNVPGSFRRYDMSDGLFIGGVLNGVPQQYVRFSATGIEVSTPNKLTISAATGIDISTPQLFTLRSQNFTIDNAGSVAMHGTLNATGDVIAGNGTSDQVGLQTHHHPAINQPPTPGT